MDKRFLSERDICSKFITPALEAAGWDLQTQIAEERTLTDGRIIVRGKMVTRGQRKRADYVLYLKPNIPIAIIEAKDNKHSVADGIQQALTYAEMLQVPFAFSSNGDGFVFHDRTGNAQLVESNLRPRATPWRRQPSTLTEGPALPARPQVIPLGPRHGAGRAQTAAELGTAWHRAFRVLASRPDLASSLPAATGVDAGTLDAIIAQVSALKNWLACEGYPDLHLEVPIHVTHPDGSETLGVLDAVAMGPGRMLVIDHKTGSAPDPRARFASYWPQLAAYADAIRLTFPAHQLRGVAIHWMNEGTLSFLSLEPEVVA